MSIRPIAIGGMTLLLLLVPAVSFAQEEAPPQEESPGLACSDCHEQPETFKLNPHAHGNEGEPVSTEICESCHGDGTAHMEAGGDPELITLPRGVGGSEICAGCHRSTTHQQSRMAGVHANSEAVNCLTCHSIHAAEQTSPYLLVARQFQLCSSCHAHEASGFRNKPYSHRIGRGGMECSSCHDPHTRVGGGKIRETRSGEVACVECHADKRGPFVFAHGANEIADVTEEASCLNCHELHGSNNPKQLKRANVFQLCLECHSPITGDTLGSQPPSFHNLNLPRYRQCTTCHVAVHGSNRSPHLLK
ncbi:MAG TPA: cytochrome c3 family protein [Thermoanaerobaculia bacterium]|nr:cytochrome c3 family protein [Thermoanaerobaculia bacterium]